MKNNISNTARLSLMACAAWLVLTPATAQTAVHTDQGSVSQSDGTQLETVVVTSERRSEKLQSVPLAVSAFTGDALAAANIQGTLGLQQQVPSFVMTTNATLGQPYLRGVGTDIINVGTDPSIAVFEDGVYQARAVASVAEFNDIKRVEVIEGPQGSLFGRNATAGAISIITNKPTDQFEADGNVEYGNYNKIRTTGMLNVPLSETMALRVSAYYDYRDGFTKNQLLNTRVDGLNLWGVRAATRFTFNNNLVLTLTGEYTNDNSTRNLAPIVNPTTFSPAVNVFGGQPNTDPRVVNYNVPESAHVSQAKVYGILEWYLGDVKLQSTTAYASTANRTLLDLDATEIDFVHDKLDEHSRVVTQELQFSSNDEGLFQWVAGFYYFHEDATQLLPIFVNIPAIPGTPDGIINYDGGIKTNAYAVYGQGSYRLGAFRFTAGLRYGRDEKNSTFDETITDPFHIISPYGSMSILNPQSKSWDSLSPKVGVDYFVNDNVMLYASASRGFKSGGMNLQGAGEVFNPERLWDYEGGIKATWFDGRLRTNLDGFHYDDQGMQVNIFNGATTLVTNLPRAAINGFEANITALLTPDLKVDLGLSMLDAEVGNYNTINPVTNLPVNLSGNILPRAPKTSLTASADYTLPFTEYGRFTLRGEMKYQSRMFFTYYDDPQASQGGYTIVNARLSYDSPDGRWYAAAFANNLADQLYRQSVIQSPTLLGTLLFWGPPRTFGVELGVHY